MQPNEPWNQQNSNQPSESDSFSAVPTPDTSQTPVPVPQAYAIPHVDMLQHSASISQPFVPGSPAITSSQIPSVPNPYGPPSKRYKSKLIVAAVSILLIGVVIAGLIYQSAHASSPNTVFKAALTNAFSTSSVTQSLSAGASTATIDFNTANVKDPRISATINFSVGSANAGIKADAYGSVHNTYIKVAKFSGLGTFPSNSLNKWVQIKKDGNQPSNVDDSETLSEIYDPTIAALGQYMYGNFSASDRANLLQYAISQKVYDYDTSKVTSGSVDSQSVYVYKVHINTAKLIALNKKVAALMSLNADAATQAVDSVNSDATLYISKAHSQLVKVVSDGATATYSKFNKTTLPSEPKAQLQYSDLTAQVGATNTGSNVNSTTGSNASKDAERKASIDTLQVAIEEYFAGNGSYPTFADMNSASWIAQNLKDLDTTALRDPDGTSTQLLASPAAHIYAYQVGQDSSLTSCEDDQMGCQYYVLTATLSNGTTYAVNSTAT